jgi:hypothetical protein
MADKFLGKYPFDSVWSEYSKRRGDEQRDYRNEVIFVYMQAIDARYNVFRTDLSRERKGSDMAFDGLLLGLGAIGSIWTNAAEEALIGTTSVTGARGVVDRNLYYEQTLTALVSAMEAERFRVGSAVYAKMTRDTGQYPLSAAMIDLQAYELAGTLQSAVSEMTEDAVIDRKDAKAEFDRTFRFACDPKTDLTVQTAKLRNAVMPIARAARDREEANLPPAADRERLDRIAPIFDVEPVGLTATQIGLAITEALNRDYCSFERLENMTNRLKSEFPNEPTMRGL